MQRMAMQCWCLHFQSQDHSFLLQSNMFSNISKALSGTEEGDTGSGNSEKKSKGNKVHVYTRCYSWLLGYIWVAGTFFTAVYAVWLETLRKYSITRRKSSIGNVCWALLLRILHTSIRRKAFAAKFVKSSPA